MAGCSAFPILRRISCKTISRLRSTSFNGVLGFTRVIVFALALMFFINQAIVKQGFISYNSGFLECLYFSFVTFTTLGYGDYAPSQAFQLVATAEAFFGAFMIALFVLVFGRKMLR